MKADFSVKDDVKRIFEEHGIHHEWWVQDNDNVNIVVDWGDWKHDHRFLQNLMRNNGYILLERNVTEEDEGDCFSAEYVYRHAV